MGSLKINNFKKLFFWIFRGSIFKLWFYSRFKYLRGLDIHPPFYVRLKGRDILIFGPDEAGHAFMYEEIIVRDCYGVMSAGKAALIVDIGANIGFFSRVAATLFPDAQIFAYEPNPAVLEWLRKNAQGTKIRVLPCAVCEKYGVAALEINVKETVYAKLASGGTVQVECIGASGVADGREIDLLKLDAEGSEWGILKDGELLKRTSQLRMEYHLRDGHTMAELKDLIEKGNHRIKRIRRLKNDTGYLWSQKRAVLLNI